MSLEKIAEHIEKETDTKVKRIVLEAQAKANLQLKAADKKAEEITKEADEKSKILAKEKETIEKSRTNVEKRMIIKTTISRAFKQSMDNLYKAETSFGKMKDYEKLIPALIKEAKKVLGDDAVIYFNKDDFEKFGKKEKNAKTYKKKIFGVYAESKDSKLSIDLSINKIIRRMEEKIAQKIIGRIGN